MIIKAVDVDGNTINSGWLATSVRRKRSTMSEIRDEKIIHDNITLVT